MLVRIGQAVLIAAVVGFLLAVVLGPLLVTLKIPIIVFFGRILAEWGWVIGVAAGLWAFFFGSGFSWPLGGGPKT